MSSAFHPDNDVTINPSGNESIIDVLDKVQPARRKFLKGSVTGATMAAFSGVGLGTYMKDANAAYPAAPAPTVPIGFTPVAADTLADGSLIDAVTVPPGYSVQILASWGDAIVGASTPNLNPNVAQTWQLQERQVGMHHDGSHFFPFPTSGTSGASSERGLFCLNHEYTDDFILHNIPSRTYPATGPTADQVRTSLAAHGVSVMEFRKVAGKWQIVRNSPFNRRITGYTPITVSGPAAGHPMMQTAADPTGRNVLGTLNNCAAGYTPWGTYLTCEENFNGYFGANGSFSANAHEARYGVNNAGFGYRWHQGDARFDLNQNRNEPNRFGWVVEIDPFNPRSTPVKRTALGRFKHESAGTAVGPDSSVAVYMGCDERNEYIYKFVSSVKFVPGNTANNRTILDNGTLYVAKFNADGSGQWLPLVHGVGPLTAANGFADQGEVLIKARQAADAVGATMMDRPEWVAVHPTTREVYCTLTNNNRRTTATNINASVHTTDSKLFEPNRPTPSYVVNVGTPPVPTTVQNPRTLVAGNARPPVDTANPRIDNRYGHIIRWTEDGNDVKATTFQWEVFVLAGDKTKTAANLKGNINGATDSSADFGAPDGLWFDKDGRLWIQTDQQGDATGDFDVIGTNSLLCADPATREIKRFATTPPNCETTGVVSTPDNKTFFVGIQHPGEDWDTGAFTSKSKWPDNGLNGPTTLSAAGPVKPRSALFVVTKDDGGVIGT